MVTTGAEGLSRLGQIAIEKGTIEDYRELAHLHYAPGDPAVVAGVWRARWVDCGLSNRARRPRRVRFGQQSTVDNQQLKLIAVGVLAYPTPAHRVRERVLGLGGPRYGPKLALVNRHVRTIARVIVHPQFRSMGIASSLVRRMCEDCPTRYVEAMAVMGEVVPFFERGGMRRIEGGYFIFDREGKDKRRNDE